MLDSIENLRGTVLERVRQCRSETEIEQVRLEYLGRKGQLTLQLRGLKDLPAAERPRAGEQLNLLRRQLEEEIDARLGVLKEASRNRALEEERVDITLPGSRWERGRIHPLTLVIDEIIDVFLGMGFEIARGPDIEDDYHNFEALNIPKDHPARDMQDTFYISDDIVLRTHTSPVQIRVMETHQPPIQIIAPGKVYRCDSDVSHTPMFHQVEGLLVNETVSFADLKGVLIEFCKIIFGEKTKVRFRPSFFPFTEPSAEVDISCVICKAKGCRVCKDTGWLEILGCGMVDPEVFKSVNYDHNKFRGFAFGMGVERITMLKYGINDIRLFFENDIRFLKQF